MKIRTTRPGKGNKYYITKSKGGYSTCIQGKPTDSLCNVLSNCVGYSCGAYNEEHEFGYEKYHFNCNAENFIERAIASGLSVYKNPMVGGIVVWQKGSLSSKDGAGHVAICVSVDNANNPTVIKTAESGYGSKTPFWMTTRKKGSGNWGQNSQYKYRGTIAPVGYKPEPTPSVTPNVDRDEEKDQIEVLIDNLYVRTDASKSASSIGFAHKGYYNYYENKTNDGYTWYRIADKQWIASNEGWTVVLPHKEPEPPIVLKYSVGDVMILNGYLYADAKGNGKGEERKNYKCTITKTCDEAGTTKPYNVNNGLGWVAEEDLTPYVEPPTPKTEFEIGDKVIVNGRLYGNSYGEAPGQTVKNYHTTIALKAPLNRKAPYNVYNNAKQYLGWVQTSSLTEDK